MISEHRLIRLLQAARRGPARCIAVALLLAPLTLIGACDKVPLLAPTGTTITLFTSTQLLPLGGSADVTASVLESGGTPVQNGTVVTFTTSLGSMDPAEARTNGGKATVRLVAGDRSGTAEINAFSGASQAAAKISIPIGAAAVGTVLVNAEPTRVPSTGGTSQIIATVQDTGGNVLSNVPVTFTTTTGTLSPGTATTGQDGRATTTLATNQDATVTVTAGAKTGTVAVTATAVPTITITPPATTPSVGVSSSFTFNITPGSASAPIRTVIVDWDDDTAPQQLGAATGSITVPHTFKEAGVHEVRATATDALNQTTAVMAPVDVFPAVPFTLSMSASSGRVNSPVTITATLPVGSPVITRYVWNVGGSIVGHPDGIIETNIPTVTVTYNVMPCTASVCTVQLNVTAFGNDGRLGFGSTTTTITP
jgi:adhesin/invasin